MAKINDKYDLSKIKYNYRSEMGRYEHHIYFCAGAGCISCGCADVARGVKESLSEFGLNDKVKMIETGCIGQIGRAHV